MEITPDPNGSGQLFVTAEEFEATFEIQGNCPVQSTGTVHGRELYFRARHDAWSFEVADHTGCLPMDGSQEGFLREGDYANAGWMPYGDAVKIIANCLREYTLTPPLPEKNCLDH